MPFSTSDAQWLRISVIPGGRLSARGQGPLKAPAVDSPEGVTRCIVSEPVASGGNVQRCLFVDVELPEASGSVERVDVDDRAPWRVLVDFRTRRQQAGYSSNPGRLGPPDPTGWTSGST